MSEDAGTEFRCFADFWPYYLQEHRRRETRLAHVLGTSLGVLFLSLAIIGFNFSLLLVAPLAGYGFAWLSHLLIEKNKPATWRYPLWSLLGDLQMWRLWIAGQLEAELVQHHIMT
jgi:hypothetical protein